MEFDEIVQSLASCCISIKTLLFSVTPGASSVLDEAYHMPSPLWSFYLAPSIYVFLSYLSSSKMSGQRVQHGLFSLQPSAPPPPSSNCFLSLLVLAVHVPSLPHLCHPLRFLSLEPPYYISSCIVTIRRHVFLSF